VVRSGNTVKSKQRRVKCGKKAEYRKQRRGRNKVKGRKQKTLDKRLDKRERLPLT
jgi:hypothetical protein